MQLHPETLTGVVPEAIGMAAEPVHVPETFGNAAIRHHHRDLMQGFGQKRPEVPVVCRGTHVGPWIAFDGLVEIREFLGIPQEEHRGVVTHHVPVTFFGVEFERKAANIPLGICRAAFTRHSAEAGEHLGLLANFTENFGACVVGDIVGHGERAERTGPFGVHAALRDDFAHEIRKLFVEPDILHQHGPTFPCGH